VNLVLANRALIRIATADWSQETNPANSVFGHYRVSLECVHRFASFVPSFNSESQNAPNS
jgi:hypothetical protein